MSKPGLKHNFSLSVSLESTSILMFQSLVLGLETKCTSPPKQQKQYLGLALLESHWRACVFINNFF